MNTPAHYVLPAHLRVPAETRADQLGLRFIEESPKEEGKNTPEGKVYSEDYVKTLRQEAAGHRTRAVAAEQARDAAISERDAARTELTTLQQSTADATSLVAAADARALRLEVALEQGLPLALARRLDGATKEEIEADAKALAELTGSKGTAQFDQGQTPKAPSSPDFNTALRVASGFGGV